MGISHNGNKKWDGKPCVGVMGGDTGKDDENAWWAWSRCSRADFEAHFLRITNHTNNMERWCMPGKLYFTFVRKCLKTFLFLFRKERCLQHQTQFTSL